MFASVCIITFVSANLDFDCDASFTHLDSSFITGCYIFAGKEQVSGGREGFYISYRDNKVLFIKNKVLSFLGNIWIQWSRLVIILQSGDHVADLHVGTEFVMCVCLWVEGICCWNDCACIRRKVLGCANEVVIPPVIYLHRFREVFNKSSHWTINGHWL